MSQQTVFAATGKIVTGVFYLTIFLGCLAIGVTTFNLINSPQKIDETKKEAILSFEVMNFAKSEVPSPYVYAPDNQAALQSAPNKYLLHVPYQSALGYVHYIMLLLQFGAALYIIWLLKKIFDSISLIEPFTLQGARFIRNIGLVLIGIDIAKILYYLLFSKLANDYFLESNIQLVSNIGSNIWLGLLVLALSVIYRRGVDIYSENKLTI